MHSHKDNLALHAITLKLHFVGINIPGEKTDSPMMIRSIITTFTRTFAEYPVREGKGLADVPRISKPALQKAEIE